MQIIIVVRPIFPHLLSTMFSSLIFSNLQIYLILIHLVLYIRFECAIYFMQMPGLFMCNQGCLCAILMQVKEYFLPDQQVAKGIHKILCSCLILCDEWIFYEGTFDFITCVIGCECIYCVIFAILESLQPFSVSWSFSNVQYWCRWHLLCHVNAHVVCPSLEILHSFCGFI